MSFVELSHGDCEVEEKKEKLLKRKIVCSGPDVIKKREGKKGAE